MNNDPESDPVAQIASSIAIDQIGETCSGSCRTADSFSSKPNDARGF